MGREVPTAKGPDKPRRNSEKPRETTTASARAKEQLAKLAGAPILKIRALDLKLLENKQGAVNAQISKHENSLQIARGEFFRLEAKRDECLAQLREKTVDNTIWNQIDTYLQMTVVTPLFPLSLPTFLKEIHETDLEKDIRRLVTVVNRLDKEMLRPIKSMLQDQTAIDTLRREEITITYHLMKIQGLDVEDACIRAFLELGPKMPESMQDDLLSLYTNAQELVVTYSDKITPIGIDKMLQLALRRENKALSVGLKTYESLKNEHLMGFGQRGSASKDLFVAKPFILQAIANDYSSKRLQDQIKTWPPTLDEIKARNFKLLASQAGLDILDSDKLPDTFKHSAEGSKLISQGFSHNVFSEDVSAITRKYNSIYYKKFGDHFEYVAISPRPGIRARGIRLYRSKETAKNLAKSSNSVWQTEQMLAQVIATNPRVSKLSTAAVRLQTSLAKIQSAYSAEATKTQTFVDFMKNEAQGIKVQIEDLQKQLPQIKETLGELNVFLNKAPLTPFQRKLKQKVSALDDFVSKLESAEISKFCDHVLSSNYSVDTLGTFFVREAIPFLVSIGVAVAAVVAAFPSGGSSLLGLAAISAAAGVVGHEIGLGISDLTGEMFFGDDYDNLPLAARGLDWHQLISAYGQQFAYGFAMTFGLLGAGQVIGKSLSKYMSRHGGRATIHGQFVAQLEKIPRIGYRTIDVSTLSGRQQFLSRFGKEFAEEIGEELTEEMARKLDSRLGLLVSIAFCTTTHNVRLHLDGAPVSVLDNSFDAQSGMAVSNFSYNNQNAAQVKSSIYRKYKPEQITELENGSYSVVVQAETKQGNYEHKLNFINTNMDTELLAALNPKVREQYGIEIDTQRETISYSKLLLDDNLSLISVLELKGYEVTNLSVKGFVAVKNGLETTFASKTNLKLPSQLTSTQAGALDVPDTQTEEAIVQNDNLYAGIGQILGINTDALRSVLPVVHVDLKAFAEKIIAQDFSNYNAKELATCMVLSVALKDVASNEQVHNFAENLQAYLARTQANVELAPAFLQLRSYFGDLGYASFREKNKDYIDPENLNSSWDFGNWETWLKTTATTEELRGIFTKLGVSGVASADVSAMYERGIDIANIIGQPYEEGAHFYTPARYAVDLDIQAGAVVKSPIAGEVVEVHSLAYDLNLEMMDYFDRCKAEDAELTLAGVKQHMMIANETVAANNLELAQRFVNDSSLQANFMTAVVASLIDFTTSPKADGITIKDEDGNLHEIYHAQALLNVGDKVTVGQPIVRLDYNSGMSSEPHVHYEVNNSEGLPIPIVDISGVHLYDNNLPGLDRYARTIHTIDIRTRFNDYIESNLDRIEDCLSRNGVNFTRYTLSQKVNTYFFGHYAYELSSDLMKMVVDLDLLDSVSGKYPIGLTVVEEHFADAHEQLGPLLQEKPNLLFRVILFNTSWFKNVDNVMILKSFLEKVNYDGNYMKRLLFKPEFFSFLNSKFYNLYSETLLENWSHEFEGFFRNNNVVATLNNPKFLSLLEETNSLEPKVGFMDVCNLFTSVVPFLEQSELSVDEFFEAVKRLHQDYHLRQVYKFNSSTSCEFFVTFVEFFNQKIEFRDVSEDAQAYVFGFIQFYNSMQGRFFRRYFDDFKVLFKRNDISHLQKLDYIKAMGLLEITDVMQVNKLAEHFFAIVMNSSSPLESVRMLEDQYSNNLLPEFSRRFRIFKYENSPDLILRHARIPSFESVSEQNVTSVIFKDLIRVVVNSCDLEIQEFVEVLSHETEFFDFNNGWSLKNGVSVDDPRLVHFLESLKRLHQETFNLSHNFDSEVDLIDYYKLLRSSFNLSPNQSVADKFVQIYLKQLNISSLSELKLFFQQHNAQIDVRNRNQNPLLQSDRLEIKAGYLLKGLEYEYFAETIQRGFVSREHVGAKAESDNTPYDIDLWYHDAPLSLQSGGIVRNENMELTSDKLETYGDVTFIIVPDAEFVLTESGKVHGLEVFTQVEYFRNGYLANNHYGIRTGLAIDKVNGLILSDKLLADKNKFLRMKLDLVVNDKYLPMFDNNNELIFTEREFDQMRRILTNGRSLKFLHSILDTQSLELADLSLKNFYLAYREEFNTEVVSEGYDLLTHTYMVLSQLEKLQAQYTLPEGISFEELRLFLILHDIGKPKANLNNTSQHAETSIYIGQIADRFHFSASTRGVFEALISQDLIGDLVKGIPKNVGEHLSNVNSISAHVFAGTDLNFEATNFEKSLLKFFGSLKELSQEANMSPKDFLRIFDIYYKCDASSYTSDSEGYGSLNFLFENLNAEGPLEYNANIRQLFESLYSVLDFDESNVQNAEVRQGDLDFSQESGGGQSQSIEVSKYESLANKISLYEDKVKAPEQIPPGLPGNMFESGDRQTLAGKIIAKIYNELKGDGEFLAGPTSERALLSGIWEPNLVDTRIWKEVSGSTKNVSFHAFEATKIVPFYLRRMAEVHRKKGNINEAIIFDTEANRVEALINGESLEQNLPEFVGVETQRKFFEQLESMREIILKETSSQHSKYRPAPVPMLCGFTASALTKRFRETRSARTVYGHYSGYGDIGYHYWTEVKGDDNQVYVVDATYGQFDPSKEGEIVVFPVSELEKYGLSEFKEGDTSILGYDEMTVQTLKENNGELPIENNWSDERLEAFKHLVSILQDDESNVQNAEVRQGDLERLRTRASQRFDIPMELMGQFDAKLLFDIEEAGITLNHKLDMDIKSLQFDSTQEKVQFIIHFHTKLMENLKFISYYLQTQSRKVTSNVTESHYADRQIDITGRNVLNISNLAWSCGISSFPDLKKILAAPTTLESLNIMFEQIAKKASKYDIDHPGVRLLGSRENLLQELESLKSEYPGLNRLSHVLESNSASPDILLNDYYSGHLFAENGNVYYSPLNLSKNDVMEEESDIVQMAATQISPDLRIHNIESEGVYELALKQVSLDQNLRALGHESIHVLHQTVMTNAQKTEWVNLISELLVEEDYLQYVTMLQGLRGAGYLSDIYNADGKLNYSSNMAEEFLAFRMHFYLTKIAEMPFISFDIHPREREFFEKILTQEGSTE